MNNYAKAHANAIRHWTHYVPQNTPEHYNFIRNSPVVEFQTNANIIKMLKLFSLNPKQYNVYLYNKSRWPHLAVKRHHKYYIMNVKPFIGNRLPGRMVPAYNHLEEIGLVNKALMNRYITQRSLERLAKEKYTLSQAKKLMKVANILNQSIQRRKETARQIGTAWRNIAAFRAAKRRWTNSVTAKNKNTMSPN